MIQDKTRIPRWVVENDPSWEKTFDLDLGVLKWTKKGSTLQAICTPTSIYCEILNSSAGDDDVLLDPATKLLQHNNPNRVAGEISKYLSSRYLNPTLNRTFSTDITKNNPFRMRKF